MKNLKKAKIKVATKTEFKTPSTKSPYIVKGGKK